MLNRLLPDVVTYYRLVSEAGECRFERQVLCPVRLQVERVEADGIRMENGVLYLFPRELMGVMPEMDVGDFFVRGIREEEEPPKDGSAFLVRSVSPLKGVDEMKFVRVDGCGNGGGADA